MFLFFFVSMVVASLLLLNILYMWVILELIFFMVISVLIYLSGKKVSMNGVMYYLFVQAMSGLVLILAFLSEICYYSNMFILNNSISVLNYFFCLMSLLMKLSFYPFYIQITVIMSFLNMDQGLLFLIYPKLLPMIMLYELVQQDGAIFVLLLLSIMLLMISSTQSVMTTDTRMILSWSSMSQLSWMVLSVFSNLFIFLFFFLFYSLVLGMFVRVMSSVKDVFFLSFSSLSMGRVSENIIFLVLMMMSSLAPFFLFYLKVVLIMMFPNSFFSFFMLVMLMFTVGVLFFYLRMFQFLISVSYTAGYYKSDSSEFKLSMGMVYFFLLNLLGGIIVLMV